LLNVSQGNDGILCVGTTNHLDRLDPALSNRPSRFDKNYFFGDPNRDERALYVRYWYGKVLKSYLLTDMGSDL
jgi:transitional endoplasmic reticulum ATPase